MFAATVQEAPHNFGGLVAIRCSDGTMKILMATHYFGSHKGGIEIVADELFRGLAAREQQVVWVAGDVTPPPDPVGRSRTVPLHVLNWVEKRIGLPFPIPTPNALKKLAVEVSEADVVLLHDCLYLSNIAAFLIAKSRNIPVVIVQHTRLSPYNSNTLNAVMSFSNAVVTRPMLSQAGQVVFISETTNNFFANLRYRRPPEVVFNGVDTKLYRPPVAEEKASLRRQYELPGGQPVILFAGRFVEKKGISILKRMVALKPTWTWVFAGWGPLDPCSWNAENALVFSGLRGSSMADLYRACDLLVLPSTGEGFPLVVQEALASGLPVVCGDETLAADPGMEPFVRGVPVYAGDDERTSQEFVSAIDELLKSDAGSRERSEGRRAFAATRYSWQHAIERYLEIASLLVSPATSGQAVSQ